MSKAKPAVTITRTLAPTLPTQAFAFRQSLSLLAEMLTRPETEPETEEEKVSDHTPSIAPQVSA